MDHGAASYNSKVPNCSDNMQAWNWRVSNLRGYLWGLIPDTNSLVPLLQHSALFPSQGMVDQPWCAAVLLDGSNVQGTAQAVEDWEVILWVLYSDAALTPRWSSSSPACSPGILLDIVSLFHSEEDFKIQL